MSNEKSPNNNINASDSARVVAGVDPLPPQGSLVVPDAFVARKRTRSERRAPIPRAQIEAMPKVVAEVRASIEYVLDFGGRSPKQDDVVAILELAAGWTERKAALRRMLSYCDEQEHAAWTEADLIMAELRTPYLYLAEREPEIVSKQYGAMGRFYQATIDRSHASARTRKAKKAAKDKPAENPADGAGSASSSAASSGGARRA